MIPEAEAAVLDDVATYFSQHSLTVAGETACKSLMMVKLSQYSVSRLSATIIIFKSRFLIVPVWMWRGNLL